MDKTKQTRSGGARGDAKNFGREIAGGGPNTESVKGNWVRKNKESENKREAIVGGRINENGQCHPRVLLFFLASGGVLSLGARVFRQVEKLGMRCIPQKQLESLQTRKTAANFSQTLRK